VIDVKQDVPFNGIVNKKALVGNGNKRAHSEWQDVDFCMIHGDPKRSAWKVY
jgi:hypothetical protein